MKLEEIIRTGLSRVDTIRVVRTALNPLLWLVGLTTPAAFILAALIGDQFVRLILLGFAAIPVVATLVAYVIFMFVIQIDYSQKNTGSDNAPCRYFTKRAGVPK
jgi:hypothetical protein